MEFLFVCFVFLFSFLFRLNICAVNFASLPLRGKRSRPYKFILLSMDCATRARETISFYNWAINMSRHKLLTLNVRGLNSSRKRRQVFRRLHLQRSDIIFLQETYSSTGTIKRWEAEWGGKVVASHGTTHSKGVMVLFKPISMSLSTKP